MIRRTAAGAVLVVSLVVGLLSGCGGDDGGDQKAFCRALRDAPPLAQVVSGITNADPDELRAKADAAQDAYDRAAEDAPSAIDDEMDDLHDLVVDVLKAIRAHPTDVEASTAAIRRAAAKHRGTSRSATAVVSYARKHCNLELDPRTAPTTTSPPVATSPVTGPPAG